MSSSVEARPVAGEVIWREARGLVSAAERAAWGVARVGWVASEEDMSASGLRVERVLEYAADLRMEEEEPVARRARIKEVVGMMGLAELKPQRMRELSCVERWRVRIAQELLTRPEVLGVELPVGGQGEEIREALEALLERVAASQGCAVMCVGAWQRERSAGEGEVQGEGEGR